MKLANLNPNGQDHSMELQTVELVEPKEILLLLQFAFEIRFKIEKYVTISFNKEINIDVKVC